MDSGVGEVLFWARPSPGAADPDRSGTQGPLPAWRKNLRRSHFHPTFSNQVEGVRVLVEGPQA
jgi:hypothetical protein